MLANLITNTSWITNIVKAWFRNNILLFGSVIQAKTMHCLHIADWRVILVSYKSCLHTDITFWVMTLHYLFIHICRVMFQCIGTHVTNWLCQHYSISSYMIVARCLIISTIATCTQRKEAHAICVQASPVMSVQLRIFSKILSVW